MEFLLIGESKIKIVLSEDEVREYKIGEENVSVGGRRAFFRILDLAKKSVGFDPSGDKILIQLYPINSGGCEVFVTKLGVLPESSAKLVARSNRISVLERRRGFYSFSSIEDLACLSRIILSMAEDEEISSDVYEFQGGYYLSIDEYGKGGEPLEFPCILEFGCGLTADAMIYILEHATCLTDGDAIKRFSRL